MANNGRQGAGEYFDFELHVQLLNFVL